MKVNFPSFVTNKKTSLTKSCTLVIQKSADDEFIAAIRQDGENEDTNLNVGVCQSTMTDAIEDLIQNLDTKGYRIDLVTGTTEVEKNEIITYMMNTFTIDFEIPFNATYRMKLQPNTVFGNTYTRYNLAINVNDNLPKLNYMLLVGELRSDGKSFGGLLLNERNELIYKVDKAETDAIVKERVYTYIEQYIGEITHQGFSFSNPNIKTMIDDLRK